MLILGRCCRLFRKCFFGWGTGVDGNLAGFFSNLTPLFAALLSLAFLGELPHLYHGAAFLLIIGGIYLSSRQ